MATSSAVAAIKSNLIIFPEATIYPTETNISKTPIRTQPVRCVRHPQHGFRATIISFSLHKKRKWKIHQKWMKFSTAYSCGLLSKIARDISSSVILIFFSWKKTNNRIRLLRRKREESAWRMLFAERYFSARIWKVLCDQEGCAISSAPSVDNTMSSNCFCRPNNGDLRPSWSILNLRIAMWMSCNT